jgi:ATP-dependent Zn protease
MNYLCLQHSCVKYQLSTNGTDQIGSMHEVSVAPGGVYTLVVVAPDGSKQIITTNELGIAFFKITMPGNYNVYLQKDGAAAQSATVSVVNAIVTPTQPQKQGIDWVWYIIILLILLAIFAAIWYFFIAKKKGGNN